MRVLCQAVPPTAQGTHMLPSQGHVVWAETCCWDPPQSFWLSGSGARELFFYSGPYVAVGVRTLHLVW